MLRSAQGFFRGLVECVAHAKRLYEIARRGSLRVQEAHAECLDFSKTYNRVPNPGLIAKRRRYGPHGKLLKVLNELYEHSRASARVYNARSDSFDYTIGVRQGYPASPILFNLYINDLFDGLSGIRLRDMTLLVFCSPLMLQSLMSRWALQDDLGMIEAGAG